MSKHVCGIVQIVVSICGLDDGIEVFVDDLGNEFGKGTWPGERAMQLAISNRLILNGVRS
jgi:hypothetical protein